MTLAELLNNCNGWTHLSIRKEFVDGDVIRTFYSWEDISEKYLNSKVNENEFYIFQDPTIDICIEVGLLWI